MRKFNLAAFALIAASALSLSACDKSDSPAKKQIASPACADLANTTDPAQRAELEKKCPRSGAVFTPSPAKSY
jgi:entry exclusion lipoprotein TrbK